MPRYSRLIIPAEQSKSHHNPRLPRFGLQKEDFEESEDNDSWLIPKAMNLRDFGFTRFHDICRDLKGRPTEALPPEVIETNGRPVGTRTPDLYRVK